MFSHQTSRFCLSEDMRTAPSKHASELSQLAAVFKTQGYAAFDIAVKVVVAECYRPTSGGRDKWKEE